MTLILKSLKTIYNKNMSVEEFLQEFHHSKCGSPPKYPQCLQMHEK